MRVIAGEFRGRILLAPEGNQTTRPITDRVKQSVFDILAPLIENAVVHDCFAGTGSMGLECLSRGASQAVFFERDRSAGQRLQNNIASLGVTAKATVITGDLFHWFENSPVTQRADLLFLDPPYRFLKEQADDLRKLAENLAAKHLTETATVVFRHDSSDALALPPLRVYDVRKYGAMTVEFLTPSNIASSPPV